MQYEGISERVVSMNIVNQWDNIPLFVKYNPGLLKLASLLGETG